MIGTAVLACSVGKLTAQAQAQYYVTILQGEHENHSTYISILPVSTKPALKSGQISEMI